MKHAVHDIRREAVALLGLVACTAAVYIGVWRFEFISFDDLSYVPLNSHVRNGLTWRGVLWAFTSLAECNWHPLTWLSHMADVSLFGLEPGGHHVVNVLLHLGNALLLYWLLRRATSAVWRSALVAALFAVHPVHVESVAWVAERKDVLSTFFALLACHAYLGYVRGVSLRRYVAVAGCFVLSLMAKPTHVTLPFLLLLLDYWPLGRLHESAGGRMVRPVLLEKLPLLSLSALSAVVTLVAQERSLAQGTEYPLGMRVANALYAYGQYVYQALAPMRLSMFYPLVPKRLSDVDVLLSLGGLLCVTGLCLWAAHRGRKLYLVGWGWYLGTLVPMIGVVQVGGQARADRYMYWPMVGLLLMAVWGVHAGLRRLFPRRHIRVSAILGLCAVAIYAGIAGDYASKWQNSLSLYRHALQTTGPNSRILSLYGLALFEKGRVGEARRLLEHSLRMNPYAADVQGSYGVVLVRQKQYREALEHFRRALSLDPQDRPALEQAVAVHIVLEQFEQAHALLRAAMTRDPQAADLNVGMAALHAAQQRYAEAQVYAQRALQADPRHAGALYHMGGILIGLGRPDEARMHLERAVNTDKGNGLSRLLLGIALARCGRGAEALSWLDAGLRLNPERVAPAILKEMAMIYMQQGQPRGALRAWGRILDQQGDDVEILNNMAWVRATSPQASVRNGAEALRLAQQAADLSQHTNARTLDTLAAALAEAGRFPDAAATARRALGLLDDEADAHLRRTIHQRLEGYEAGRPWRDSL